MKIIITAWTHTELHAWLDYRCWRAEVQQSDGRNLTHHRVFDRVDEADDVGSPSQVFKNFNFTFDLLLLDGLRKKRSGHTFSITKINREM